MTPPKDDTNRLTSSDKTRKAHISEIERPKAKQESFLIEIYGPALGKNYPIKEEVVSIGREPNNTIMIDQENVSRNHCTLTNSGGSVTIEDLASTNGTYVNDVPIRKERLRHGDLIKVGRRVFKFISGGNVEGLYHEEIYRMTITDGLTQVANKRHLFEFLEREIPRAIRFGRQLSIVMLDIDYFKQINDQYGHLDILVQAASVEPRDALLEIDEWDWRRMLDSNLTGPFLLMQSVGRILREQGGGVIVNLVCVDRESRSATAGKTGLLALTQVMANELGDHNIRVNALSCAVSKADQLNEYPEDPVDLVLYLCGAGSSHLNGKIFPFDPGSTSTTHGAAQSARSPAS